MTELLAEVRVPTTVVYAAADAIVPPEQSRRVAAAATSPVEEVEIAGADHNDAVMFDGAELVGAVGALADRPSPVDHDPNCCTS